MADTTQQQPAEELPWNGIPPGFEGIEWEERGVFQTSRGLRALSKGKAWLPEGCDYRAAVLSQPDLGKVGFTFDTENCGTRIRPVFWERRGLDNDAASALIRDTLAGLPEWRAEQAREEERSRRFRAHMQAQYEAEQEAIRTYPARMVAAAVESLATMEWAWNRAADVARARELIAHGDGITYRDAKRLEELVHRATANVERAAARLDTAYEPEMTLAVLPGVQAAALDACRVLTRMDADWARERNDAGWGKSHTVLGHVLAARESLDAAAASHALKALRRYRRQLPDELVARVFGGAAALAA